MSTVVLVKSALVSALTPLLPGVQVTYADDIKGPRKERLYCGDVEEHEVAPATMRASKVRTQEEYTLALSIVVDKRGGLEADTRALEILAAVELLLATDPKLDTAAVPPAILFATYRGFRSTTSITSESLHRTLIEASITVKARNA